MGAGGGLERPWLFLGAGLSRPHGHRYGAVSVPALPHGAGHAGESELRRAGPCRGRPHRSEEHTSELQSRLHLVCRLLLEKKKRQPPSSTSTTPRKRTSVRL